MASDESYEMAAEADAFEHALINIRLHLDGTKAVVDLTEGKLTNKSPEETDFDVDPALKDILSRCKLITKSGRIMRVHFYNIQAIIIQEEFRDLVEVVKVDLKKVPVLQNGHSYPFLKVTNSRWRRTLPDYQGGDNPDIKHFKIVSMATCIDVLACLEKAELGNSET